MKVPVPVLLPISEVNGADIGWVHPSRVVFVARGGGQRIIHYLDENGVVQLAQRKYLFPDHIFMAALGLEQ